MNDAFTTILTQAAARTMKGGKIDTDALMSNLCGSYQIDGKEVLKDAKQSKTSTADAGRNDD